MEKVGFDQLELNPFTVIGDEAFLLTSGGEDSWNTMAAAWGGFGFLWPSPTVYVFVRDSRYTCSFMENSGRFSLSFFSPGRHEVIDYCGEHSGRDTDKVRDTGLTPFMIDGAVSFEEANLIITCEKTAGALIDRECIASPDLIEKFYKDGDSHHMYAGRVIGIYAVSYTHLTLPTKP